MPEVKLTDTARYDLWSMYSYLVEEADIETADRFTDEFLKKFQMLAEFKMLGSPRFELKPNLRIFPHGKYLIFYFPTDFGVEIFRVLHSARNIPEIIENDLLN